LFVPPPFSQLAGVGSARPLVGNGRSLSFNSVDFPPMFPHRFITGSALAFFKLAIAVTRTAETQALQSPPFRSSRVTSTSSPLTPRCCLCLGIASPPTPAFIFQSNVSGLPSFRPYPFLFFFLKRPPPPPPPPPPSPPKSSCPCLLHWRANRAHQFPIEGW